MSNRSNSARRTGMKERAREAAGQAILEAVEAVAVARGVDNISIAAIAEAAGVAVGTLYNYFADRDELLGAWTRMRRAELAPLLEAAATVTRDLPFEQRLRGYLSGVLAAFEAKRGFVRILTQMDQAGLVRKERKHSTMQVIHAELAAIIAPETANAELAAQLVIGSLKALVLYRIERDEPLTGDADFLVTTFLKGIR